MANPLQITVPAGSYEDLGSQDPQDVVAQIMQMRQDAGAPDQTPSEIVDWRFPSKDQKFTTRGFDPERDAEQQAGVDDWIKMKLMQENAPVGSAQETVNQRFPTLGWREDAEMTPAFDAVPETADEAYRGVDSIGLQHYWRNLPKLTNEAGAAAWMADRSGPYSANIEDRRSQTDVDAARGIMKQMMGDEDLSQLSPQDYINQVIGGMHYNEFYRGAGAEDYHLVPGASPRDFNQADFYPTRKVSR